MLKLRKKFSFPYGMLINITFHYNVLTSKNFDATPEILKDANKARFSDNHADATCWNAYALVFASWIRVIEIQKDCRYWNSNSF